MNQPVPFALRAILSIVLAMFSLQACFVEVTVKPDLCAKRVAMKSLGTHEWH